MKKITALLFILFTLNILTSCSYEDMMDKLIPQEEAELAKNYLNKLKNKDYKYVKSLMSKETLSQANDELLVKMSNYFRKGELLSLKVIGSQVHTFKDSWQGNFTFEYQFTDGWNLANVVFEKIDGKYEAIGLNVYQTDISQKELHAFNLNNKSILQYIVLLFAIVIPLFILITTYYCARTPIPRRKWAWIIFILLGVFAFQVNWTTGAFGYQPISISLLGVSGGAAGPYAPLVISISFPLGAVMFWFRRKNFIKNNKIG